HMAGALGTPLVALYGYQDPAVTGPVGDRGPVRVIRHPFPCSPCHGWVKESCVDNICMKAIAPEEVLGAILSVLRRP
ncbi:MAG: hypothetical protein K8I02_08240, partial [Candidatus Methylomirabilis sp.]|nr:hypothetical protein [Deltaproteobacteria bacterium]